MNRIGKTGLTHHSTGHCLLAEVIAPEVRFTVSGYNLATLAIFAVPWALSSVIGLTARAIEKTPVFPTYPEGPTASQVPTGYVISYTIHVLLDSGEVQEYFYYSTCP